MLWSSLDRDGKLFSLASSWFPSLFHSRFSLLYQKMPELKIERCRANLCLRFFPPFLPLTGRRCRFTSWLAFKHCPPPLLLWDDEPKRSSKKWCCRIKKIATRSSTPAGTEPRTLASRERWPLSADWRVFLSAEKLDALLNSWVHLERALVTFLN